MSKGEVRVGVFLCDCGLQISQIIDFDVLQSYAEDIPGVVSVERYKAFCYETGLRIMQNVIKKQRIERVVVAACSPKICEMSFSVNIEKIGLNPYFLEIVNLREQCVWPHLNEPKRATEKAKSLLYAAVERAKRLEPITPIEIPIKNTALVIGGGIAGVQSTIDLADIGYRVYIVERQPYLGGLASRLGRVFPTDDCALCVTCPACCPRMMARTPRKCLYRAGIGEIPNIEVITNANITSITGEVGSFQVTLEKTPRFVNEFKCIGCKVCELVCPVEVPDKFNAYLSNRKAIYMPSPQVHPPIYTIDKDSCRFEECGLCAKHCPMNAIEFDQKPVRMTFEVGTIIVATGFEEYDPSELKEYGYDRYPNVVTQLKLARMLDTAGPTKGNMIRPSDRRKAKKVVMIQCVGSRDEKTNLYCSGICCMIALKHAQMIKERDPNADVSICYIDIRTTGKGHEEYYRKARELGVKFIKGRPSEIIEDQETKNLVVEVEDILSGRLLELEADLVVLSTAFVPAKGTEKLAKMLGIEIGPDGFFKEMYSKLRPAETELEGIFICGGAQGPKDIPTTSMHATAAALKAVKLMTQGKLIKDRLTAVVDEDLCGSCEFCRAVCPYSAIEMVEFDKGRVARVLESKCRGCGTCAATCPADAIQLRHWRDDQMLAQIEGLFIDKVLAGGNGDGVPTILAFCCDECGYAAADTAGLHKMQYPTEIRILRVPCTGRVKIFHIMKAFEVGADAVMVIGCKKDGCHYLNGSMKAEMRVHVAKKLLWEMGIESDRLEMFFVPCIEADKFIKATELMMGRVKELGVLSRVG